TPAIAAQPRPNAIRFGADAVGQAQAPIRQSDQARRVAFAQVGHRRLLVLPRLAVVLRTVGVEPALRPLAAADRREQFGSAQADGGRHDGVAPGLVTDPGDELPAPAAVTGANAQGTALAAVRLRRREEQQAFVLALDHVVRAGGDALLAEQRQAEGTL